jgi:imidazoleglycerol phosphate synthase glutamine amidotransferase subunit HisH
MQFDPGKSGELGLKLVERFAKLSEKVGTS